MASLIEIIFLAFPWNLTCIWKCNCEFKAPVNYLITEMTVYFLRNKELRCLIVDTILNKDKIYIYLYICYIYIYI